MSDILVLFVSFTSLILTSSAQQPLAKPVRDVGPLGGVQCTSQRMQYQVEHMKVFLMAFKDVNKRGNSEVYSVVVGNQTEDPKCYAKLSGSFHLITVNFGDCKTQWSTFNGSINFENFAIITLRTKIGLGFVQQQYKQSFRCSASNTADEMLPIEFVNVLIESEDTGGKFDITLSANIEMSREEFGIFGETEVATLTFNLTNPEDHVDYYIYVDSCNMTQLPDRFSIPSNPVIVSRGQIHEEFVKTEMVQITQGRPAPAVVKIGIVSFEPGLKQELYFHCKLNKCTKQADELCSDPILIRGRIANSEPSALPSLITDKMTASVKQVPKAYFSKGKIVKFIK